MNLNVATWAAFGTLPRQKLCPAIGRRGACRPCHLSQFRRQEWGRPISRPYLPPWTVSTCFQFVLGTAYQCIRCWYMTQGDKLDTNAVQTLPGTVQVTLYASATPQGPTNWNALGYFQHRNPGSAGSGDSSPARHAVYAWMHSIAQVDYAFKGIYILKPAQRRTEPPLPEPPE